MKAFYAYPSSLVDVTQVIHAAKSILSATRHDLELQLWEENDISGRPLTDPIFEGIAKADFFIADSTAMNFNVTFEIGYAIGLGTRVYLTRDGNIPRDRALADRIGIFDTVGFETDTDEQQLSELVKTYRSIGGIPLRSHGYVRFPLLSITYPEFFKRRATNSTITGSRKEEQPAIRKLPVNDKARHCHVRDGTASTRRRTGSRCCLFKIRWLSPGTDSRFAARW